MTAPPTGPVPIDEPTIERLAGAERLLVASDFDGVLAPIVDDPERSAPLPEAIDALARLAAADDTEVAIVSGRERRQLEALVPEPQRFVLVGSHGAELDGVGYEADPDPGRQHLLADLIGRLRSLADRSPGLFIEVKALSVAAHFRRIDDHGARRRATDAVDRLRRAWSGKVVTGKEVVEFTVATATKGDAILALGRRSAATTTVYLGDDVTDEDAFTALGPGDVGIKVGPGPTAASHRVGDPSAVAEFLDGLARRRGS